METLGHGIQVLGEVLVGYTAIRVHYRVWKEHRIDENVFKIMSRERVLGIVGISLIIIGFLIQVVLV